MVSFKDIYNVIDFNIVKNGFWDLNIDEKKELIDLELKKYIILKINEYSNERLLNIEKLTIFELFEYLAEIIPVEEHFNELRHFTHYILGVSSSLQNYSVTWHVEDNEEPFADFNEFGLWDTFNTSEDTSYIQTFKFAYETFNKNFMLSEKIKKHKY